MEATDLAFAGAATQADLVRRRAVSAREVVEATLVSIEATDHALRAYRVVCADQAFAEADRIDAAPGGDRPLLGVPVAIKDDTDVAGEVTAWGTDAYGPARPNDAEVVGRLRRAGAIVIGKTHVPEMTLWPWTASPTWGASRNPWDDERTPGGSSGGSAVAVATGMCGVALGSDGGGSIRYPSALTGLFGLKPQRDRIPLGAAHADAWNGLTVLGPLARCVLDAALFLDATADARPESGFASALDQPVGRLRIAVSFRPPPASFARLDDDHRAAVEQTADLLRELGHDVFEAELAYGSQVMANATTRYVAGLAHDVATMPRPERLAATTRRLSAVGSRIPAGVLRRARRQEAAIAARMNRSFDQADVVLCPMIGRTAPLIADAADGGLLSSLLHANVAAWAVPWNVIGQPAASVPAGFDAAGLPLAVQLCGPAHDEVTLLRLAAQLEAARPWAQRRPVDPSGTP